MKLSVCGKGGSGKSTVVALLAHQGLARNLRVLVVDSDESNSGLYRMLGLENPPAPLMELVGGKANLKEGMSRSSLLNAAEFYLKDIPAAYLQGRDGLCQVSIGKILQALEGCACPMGVLSREFLKKLRMGADEVAIIDMEAGIEHFGRGIDEGIDLRFGYEQKSFGRAEQNPLGSGGQTPEREPGPERNRNHRSHSGGSHGIRGMFGGARLCSRNSLCCCRQGA